MKRPAKRNVSEEIEEEIKEEIQEEDDEDDKDIIVSNIAKTVSAIEVLLNRFLINYAATIFSEKLSLYYFSL